jgi:hypothetical protein
MVLLGRYDEVWEDLEKPLLILTLIGMGMAFLGLGIPVTSVDVDKSVIQSQYEGERGYTRSVAYTLCDHLLGCWPLVFAGGVLGRRHPATRVMSFLIWIGYLTLQVYFTKRAPSARAACYFLSAVIVSVLFVRKQGIQMMLVGILAVSMAGAFLWARPEVALLYERFYQEDTSRIDEAMMMSRCLSREDWIIGTGMGGYFVPEVASMVTVAGKGGEEGKSALHIGLSMPLLKGGLILLVAFCFLMMRALRGAGRRAAWNRYDGITICVLPVFGLFLLTEGFPSYGSPFDALLLGLLLGRARKRAWS